MNSAHTPQSVLWLGAAALAFFAMAASSPECSRTSDRTFGPKLETAMGPDQVRTCEHDCRMDSHRAIREERHRHREAGKACNGDAECHAAEDALHESTLAEIEADFGDCVIACQHQQGSGFGGQ